MVRESIEQRAVRAEHALQLYQSPLTVRDVADEMKVSYGTAYALIKQAGGPKVFRTRGTKVSGHTIEE